MKTRIIVTILIMVMMMAFIGCEKADRKTASSTSDKAKEIAVETEIIDEENAVSYEEDKGTEEELVETVVEEVASESSSVEQVQPEEKKKTETKKEQTKTETFATTTPVISESVPTQEGHEHNWQREEITYEYKKSYVNGCNGCGYPLFTITEKGGQHLENLYFHPPYETDRYDEPCTGGGFHNESLTQGHCYFCGDSVVYRQCMWTVMGKRCATCEVLGPYEKYEFDQNHFMYLDTCRCQKNWIIIRDEDGKGLILVKEYCTICGEEKTTSEQ